MKRFFFYTTILILLPLLSACQPTLKVNVDVEPTSTSEVEPTPVPDVEPTTVPKDLGKLAYIQQGDLWVKTLPAGEPQRLTQDGNNSAPLWSPSGKWLAFRKNDFSVWLIDAGGNTVWALNDGAAVDSFAWSPIEDRLVYSSGSEIYTVAADGKNLMPLTSTGTGDHQGPDVRIGRFVWSPDGARIAYERRVQPANQPPTEQGIQLISLDGSGPVEIYQGDASLAGWTSDGHYLLFWEGFFSSASLAADGVPLYALPVDGGSPVKVVDVMLPYRDFIAFDPTKTDQLLVVSGAGRESWSNKTLMLLRMSAADGSVLTPSGQAISAPAWSPDGGRIAFVASPETQSQELLQGNAVHQVLMQRKIWILARNGASTPRQLTNDQDYRDENPLWSKDGSSILFARFDQEDRASLWFVSLENGEPVQLVDQLSPGPEWFGNYGHVEWDRIFNWWDGDVRQ